MLHRLRRHLHWHRPHHHVGWGLVVAGGILIIFILPPFIWVGLLGAYLCYLGWQLLCQR